MDHYGECVHPWAAGYLYPGTALRIRHLRALEALEASVRHGSFRAAAAELGITPAAVGQLVRNLEQDLGTALLNRTAKGFTPTETTLAACARLSEGLDHVRTGNALLGRGQSGNRLHLSVTPSIGERWLTPRLMDFLSRRPGIDLRVDSTPYAHHVWSEQFDFAVRYDRPGRSGHDETPLFHDILAPVCTPTIAERIGRVPSSSCLNHVPLIHVDRSTDDSDWLHWEDWGQKFGIEIPKRSQGLHFAYTTMALRAMDEGHGLHLAQLSLVLPDLEAGRLVAPFPVETWVRPGFPYLLVRLSPGPESVLHRSFAGWIGKAAHRMQRALDEVST